MWLLGLRLVPRVRGAGDGRGEALRGENLAKRCSKEKYDSMRVCEVVTSKACGVSSQWSVVSIGTE